MLKLVIFILLTVGVSIIDGSSCSCCIPGQPPICQTPAINLPSCDDCTHFFCANHVKGCQGRVACEVKCQADSSSTSTSSRISSSIRPTRTTPSTALTVRVGFIMIPICFAALVVIK